MLSGFVLTTLLAYSPGQAEQPPGMLPLREQGAIPKAAEVALPPVTSGCTSCSPSVASNAPGCSGGSCYGSTCDQEDISGPPYKGWTDTSFLYYWYKPAPLPTLLTTRINGGRVRLNGGDADFGAVSGGRIAGGLWVNDAHTFGYGWSGFITEQRADFFAATSNGTPNLDRPFTPQLAMLINPAPIEDYGVARPGQFSGTFRAESGARLAGGELYAIKSVHYCKTRNFALLAGFRYIDLDEYLVIYQQSNAIAPGALTINRVPVNQVNLVDRFRTRNQFWGMEVGGRGEVTHKCFSFAVTAKVGLGNIHQTLDIAGQTSSPTISGGLLALSSNIGRSNPNRFGALADVSAEVGLQITEGSRLILAYDFIYLNDVIRPGSQIDPILSTRLIPTSNDFGTQSGTASPVRTSKNDDFFAYGVRIGYQLQY